MGKVNGDDGAKGDRRLYGTMGACAAAVGAGARVLRVHDVKEVADVVRVADRVFKTLPGLE